MKLIKSSFDFRPGKIMTMSLSFVRITLIREELSPAYFICIKCTIRSGTKILRAKSLL
jgi:hypothetical protein